MSKELSMEIMAPGTWNGIPFSSDRLKKIVENFKSLMNNHSVPLKIGHDEDKSQLKSTSATQHALGWAADVWVTSAGKLMAKFTDVPEVVYNAITKKLYRKVSVELDMDVTYKGKELGDVLSGVALLGAEIPAVNTIEDLQAYMSANSGTIVGSTRAIFATIKTNYVKKEEVTDMDLKELQDQVAKLTGQLTQMMSSQNDLTTENAKLKAEKAEFDRKEKERLETEKKAQVKLAREKVTQTLEEAVKQQVITPAQRESFHKMFSVDDDDAVTKIDVDLLVKSFGESKKFTIGKETAQSGDHMNEDESISVQDKVNEEIQKLMSTENISDYSVAMNRLFSRNRKLALEYRDANGTKE